MAHHVEALRALVGTVDPDVLYAGDALGLHADGVAIRDIGVSLMTRTAPKVAASNLWQEGGHRSPAEHLADLEGVSTGEARRTLETGTRLKALSAVDEAVRAGRISGQKAAIIAETLDGDPSKEAELLAGADSETFRQTRERCRKAKAAMATEDPAAAQRRIHAARSFDHRFEDDGTFRYWGTDTAEQGTKLLARIEARAERLRRQRRRVAVAAAGKDAPRERGGALRQDAVMALLMGDDRTPVTDEDPDDEATGACGCGGTRSLVQVHVQLEALRRGRARPGETCEIDGGGPVSVGVVESLMNDAALDLVFTRTGDIRAIHHVNRTISPQLRGALIHRDRTCVVPGCSVRTKLEIDHLRPFGQGGPTTLDNLARLCSFHHGLKTYEGWTLSRHGPTDDDPRWSFDPLPPFDADPDAQPAPGGDPPGPDPIDLDLDPPEPPPWKGAGAGAPMRRLR